MSDGGGDNSDLKIDQEALNNITKGLRAAIEELAGIGDETSSLIGAGFEKLSMTSMEAGHNELAKDFEDFCEIWEWGVRALIQDANTLAQKTGLAAGLHYENDKYINDTFKITANAVAGNPHLSEEEVTEKSWGELFSAETYAPDYSKESFEEAGQDIRETWQTAGDAGHKKKLTGFSLPSQPGDEG